MQNISFMIKSAFQGRLKNIVVLICFIHARNSLRIYVQKNVYAYLPQVCPFVGVLGHDASAPLENPSISTHPSIACPSISDGHNQVSGEKS